MIVEQRVYDIVPGRVADFYSLYTSAGLDVQIEHLGCMLGYYHTEIGALNQIIHLWGYTDFDDRAKRRSALFKDQRWLDYFASVIPLVTKQESKILIPAPFAVHGAPSRLWQHGAPEAASASSG